MRDPVDAPFSTRFDEQDAYCIFDDVEVPKENVWIDGDIEIYNTSMRASWYPNVMQQTSIRALTKLEFAYGLACAMAEAINDESDRTVELLGELLMYVEMTRSALVAAETNATTYESGAVYYENRGDLPAAGTAARVVHPGKRHHQDHRKPQSAGGGQRRATRGWTHRLVGRGVPTGCQGRVGPAPQRDLPTCLGLHRLTTRESQRAVRTQLLAVDAVQPHDVAAGALDGGESAWGRADPKAPG